MFKRLIYEDWQASIPIAAFLITFAVFVVFFIRAIRLGKKEADRMARLPLNSGRSDDQLKEKEGPSA